MTALTMDLPEALVEQIAERAAAILAEHQSSPATDGWLTVAECAEYLRCSTGRLYQLVSARRVPYSKDGSRVLFRRSAIDRWVEQGGAKCP